VDQILFSDEKLFTVEAVSNRQNDRILAPRVSDISDDILVVPHSQHPQAVMVWAGVSANSHTDLVFVPPGVKINSQTYRQLILDPVVKHAGQTIFNNQHWTFQQDGAPAHTSKASQDWLRREIPNFISKDEWPPSSPDLNLLDFSIWSILEARVSSTRYHSIVLLKAALVCEWEKIPQEHMHAAVHVFHPRLKACVSKHGGYFE
jgi:hypothetical protein